MTKPIRTKTHQDIFSAAKDALAALRDSDWKYIDLSEAAEEFLTDNFDYFSEPILADKNRAEKQT